jgi:hypothetical protein
MAARASQLFHTIVVVGTAMGCGNAPQEVPVPDGSTLPAPDGHDPDPLAPADCPALGQYECDGGADACTCNLQAPLGVCDCARPGEFRCRDCLSGPPVLGRCPLGDGVTCFCNTSIDIAAPTDCAYPEQFTCAPAPLVVEPADASVGLAGVGWFDFGECSCDTTRPIVATDCTCSRCSFACSTDACPSGTAGAALSGVPFDCNCVSSPVPIAPSP